jgi:hypothetical protein
MCLPRCSRELMRSLSSRGAQEATARRCVCARRSKLHLLSQAPQGGCLSDERQLSPAPDIMLRNASAVMCKTGPRTANRKTASRRPLQIKLFWSGGCEGNGTRPLPAPPAEQTAASQHEAGQSRPCDRTRRSHRHIHRDVVDVKPTAA